jgi:hypothetical protein
MAIDIIEMFLQYVQTGKKCERRAKCCRNLENLEAYLLS